MPDRCSCLFRRILDSGQAGMQPRQDLDVCCPTCFIQDFAAGIEGFLAGLPFLFPVLQISIKLFGILRIKIKSGALEVYPVFVIQGVRF